MIQKNLGVFAIIGLFAFSMVYVYAYEETIQLPYSDYKYKTCVLIVWSAVDMEFQCSWGYGDNATKVEYPRQGNIIPLDPTSETPIEDLLRDLKLYLEEQIVDDGPDDVIPPIEDEQPDPLAGLDPEVRKALSQLKICQLGIDEWKAIVPSYNLTTSDEAPIFKHLKQDRILKELALDYQECRGQTEYSWLSQQYNNTYQADLEGKIQERKNKGLDDSRLYEEQRTASADEIKAEADRVQFPSWYVNPYQEFTGVNRGNPAHLSNDASALLAEFEEFKAANKTTEQDLRNNFLAIQKLTCDAYEKLYMHIDPLSDKYPKWLKSACNYRTQEQ